MTTDPSHARAPVSTKPEDVGSETPMEGPVPFIQAVFEVLRRLGRPYAYTTSVPAHLLAPRTKSGSEDVEHEGLHADIPAVIVVSYRERTAAYKGPPTGDNASMRNRVAMPGLSRLTTRPLPESDPTEDGRGPLWRRLEDVPDLIRPFVTKDTPIYISGWKMETHVDFNILGGSDDQVERIYRDLLLILRTHFDRSLVGASNMAGFFIEGGCLPLSGTLPAVLPQLRTRRLTWYLNTLSLSAMPAQKVVEIDLSLGIHRPAPEQ